VLFLSWFSLNCCSRGARGYLQVEQLPPLQLEQLEEDSEEEDELQQD